MLVTRACSGTPTDLLREYAAFGGVIGFFGRRLRELSVVQRRQLRLVRQRIDRIAPDRGLKDIEANAKPFANAHVEGQQSGDGIDEPRRSKAMPPAFFLFKS